MYKVYYNGELTGWCKEDMKHKLENSFTGKFYTFEEISVEPKHLDRYV